MIDDKKLRYYTMSHRLQGYAEGLGDSQENQSLVYMLRRASKLLAEAWDEYQLTLPPDQRVGS